MILCCSLLSVVRLLCIWLVGLKRLEGLFFFEFLFLGFCFRVCFVGLVF